MKLNIAQIMFCIRLSDEKLSYNCDSCLVPGGYHPGVWLGGRIYNGVWKWKHSGSTNIQWTSYSPPEPDVTTGNSAGGYSQHDVTRDVLSLNIHV